MPRAISFCVVTRVNPLACCGDDVIELRGNNWYLFERSPYPAEQAKLRRIKRQAFMVGEILVLDKDGREIGWPQRKPSKWGSEERFDELKRAPMNYVVYPTLRAAIARSLELVLELSNV